MGFKNYKVSLVIISLTALLNSGCGNTEPSSSKSALVKKNNSLAASPPKKRITPDMPKAKKIKQPTPVATPKTEEHEIAPAETPQTDTTVSTPMSDELIFDETPEVIEKEVEAKLKKITRKKKTRSSQINLESNETTEDLKVKSEENGEEFTITEESLDETEQDQISIDTKILQIPQKGFINTYIPSTEKMGQDLISSCSLSTTYHIKVPVDHFDTDSLRVNYNYSILHPQNKNEKTVYILEIPGGPGGTGLRNIKRSETQYPKHVGVITVDPRGLGCNLYPQDKVSKSNLATKQHARDLALILKAEKLEKYIVLGASYGTVVATHLVHYIEQTEGFPKPIGVILTGTLGKAHADFSFNAPLVSLLELIKNPMNTQAQNLPRKILADRLKATSKIGFDIPKALKALHEKFADLENDSEEKKILDNDLYYGSIAVIKGMKEGAARIIASIDLIKLLSVKHLKESPLNSNNDLKSLSDEQVQLKIEYLIKQFKPFTQGLVKNNDPAESNNSTTKALIKRSEELRDQIICTELGWRKEKLDFSQTPYLISSTEELDCDSKEYFDAGDFPIKSQILYLQGGLDLQTTPEQAQYHQQAQTETGNKKLSGITSMTSGHSFAYDYNQCGVWNDFLLKGDFKGFMQIRVDKQQDHCPLPFLRYDSSKISFYGSIDGKPIR